MDTARAENPSIPTDEVCEECGEKLSLHSYDDEGDVLDCTGERYAEALIERTRKAARLTAVEFVEEFGEAYDPAETDWEGEAFAVDWSGPSNRERIAKGDGAAQYRDRCFEVYMEELEAETTKLAALLA